MSDNKEQKDQKEHQENGGNAGQEEKDEQLSEADKKAYHEIFQSLNKIDKKVKTAKSKLNTNDSNNKQSSKNTAFKQIAQKLIESKQNSQIINKEDLSTDITQSFQRNVIDIYSQNQKLKKKQAEMEKVIKQQHKKIFQHLTKQQNYIKEIQQLKFELAQAKDQSLMQNRQVSRAEPQSEKKRQDIKKGIGKYESNQNEDYDFWSMPQNDNNYSKKKKQFVQNSGLWVNQKNIGESMFITEGRR